MISVIQFIRKNWLSISLSILLIGLVSFHYFETYNPPITQAVIVSPVTKNKKLINGQTAQTKVSTPESNNPYESGFSEGFVKDTIGKILGIKEKEILSINQIKGSYKDSLQLFKKELNEQKKLTKYYQSKDRNGNVISTATTTEDGPLVYKGDISLASIIKKGNKKSPDSLIFYDPTQRVTIENSLEYKYAIPAKIKKQKLTFSAQAGAGLVIPKFDSKNLTYGYYGGVGISYNF